MPSTPIGLRRITIFHEEGEPGAHGGAFTQTGRMLAASAGQTEDRERKMGGAGRLFEFGGERVQRLRLGGTGTNGEADEFWRITLCHTRVKQGRGVRIFL